MTDSVVVQFYYRGDDETGWFAGMRILTSPPTEHELGPLPSKWDADLYLNYLKKRGIDGGGIELSTSGVLQ